MYKPKAIIFFLLTISGSAHTCELEEISASFVDQLGWDFEQEKIIETLSRPLLSQGQLWLQDNNILVWQLQYPIISTMVISPDGLRQYNAEGMLLLDDRNSMFSELSEILLSLFNKRLENLQENFSIALTCENQNEWRAQLTPLDSQLNSFIKNVTISGSDVIENISFEEQRGDITRISLSSASSIPELGIDID